MNDRMTAGKYILTLFLAVFFSSSCNASDGPLFSLEQNLTDLIFDLSRSVVTVEASQRVPAVELSGSSEEVMRSAVSSGIICDSSGHILVVAGTVVGRDRILVSFDSHSVPAVVVAIDNQSGLALLKSTAHCGGRPVDFSEVRTCAGRMIVAIGNAYGVRSSPSLGFCAGLRDDGLMQFSVQTISGSVGGGVFDLSGQLVGIMTGGLGAQNEATLAVPAYRIPEIIAHLLTQGDRHSGYVGVSSREIEISPPIRINKANHLINAGSKSPVIVKRGILVTSVVPRSPAMRAGIRVGDLIFSVDGVAVNSATGLASYVHQSQPGRIMTIELLRQDRSFSLELQVGHRAIDPIYDMEQPSVPVDYARMIDSLKHSLELLGEEILHLERLLEDDR